MKLQIVSDLHLEFAPITIENIGADALVLSGDICVAAALNYNHNANARKLKQTFLDFFSQVSANFEVVFYVLGNHEHYSGDIGFTAGTLRNFLKQWPNIILLDNETFMFRGLKIFGGTLWTDGLKGNPLAEQVIQTSLNDYRLIGNGSYNLRLSETIRLHEITLKSITNQKPDIVFGHHAPSQLSITPKYIHEVYLNGGYYSELFDFIADSNIKLWTHGHVHSSHDYMIGNTRIYCNPRGYNDENPDFKMELVKL